MSMYRKLSRKEKVNRGRLVKLSMLSSFSLSFFFIDVGLWGAAIIAILAYIGTYIVFEILDFQKGRKLVQSGIHDIDTMDGFQFEHYLVELFKKYNYKAVRTPDSGDYGADLLLNKDGQKIVVQAKRYKKNVGIKAVQEVLGAKLFYKADEAWVVANSDYTKAATKLAGESDVRLIARNELINMLMKLHNSNNQPSPKEIKATVETKDKKVCSECGSDMVLRNSKHGVFYGCVTFPKCKHITPTK
ncbi:restriction endonuclease [Robertmurraya massiliosenegalensis]|uniref:restriction endonuclease n=1 Tax=Robertmurraya massiliosenegalensis TaxID=1287657 RepID=UPI0002D89837|nr:restriction endonuclease [Robertmurraya massiliosenegalensis]